MNFPGGCPFFLFFSSSSETNWLYGTNLLRTIDFSLRRFTSCHNPRAAWRVAAPEPPSIHPHPPHASNDTGCPLPSPELPEQLRSVMRFLPHSVVVCTAAAASSSSSSSSSSSGNIRETQQPRGMTMSSFTSLTLHPTPLVTFNIGTPSRTLEAISASRTFNIHVLSGDVEGARAAEWFRRGNSSDLGVFDAAKMRAGCGCEVSKGPAAGGGGGGGEAPLLQGGGVLYALQCRLLDDEPGRGLVRVRDHVVVLAEVVNIVQGKQREGEADVFGLAYVDRRYRQLGGTVVIEQE